MKKSERKFLERYYEETTYKIRLHYLACEDRRAGRIPPLTEADFSIIRGGEIENAAQAIYIKFFITDFVKLNGIKIDLDEIEERARKDADYYYKWRSER